MSRIVRPSLRSFAVAAAAVVVLAGCAEDEPTIDVEDAPAEEPADDEEEPAEDEPSGQEPAEDDPADDGADEGEGAAAPTPDPAEVADPCGPHDGREGDAFIDVVSPVDGQDLGDGQAVELVGCSNVFEAHVAWELVAGDGAVLDDGFTTAECGTGCVGAFDEEVDLSAGGGQDGVELHVFSPDQSSGEGDGDELRQEIAVEIG